MRTDYLRVLFCHGLGCARRDLLALRIKRWATSRRFEFQSIAYGNYGGDRVWSINEWSADVEAEINRCNWQRTLLVCNSAAGQAVLRALCNGKQKNQHGGIPSLEGVLMISPGVGLELENYMERMIPGSVEQLRKGEVIEHPSADPDIQIKVNLDCLEDYVDNCVLRRHKTIPLGVPVRILHGLEDKLVPYTNSLQLMEKIQSPSKALYLVNDGHFITDQTIISHLLDSLCHKQMEEGSLAESQVQTFASMPEASFSEGPKLKQLRQ